MLLEDLVGAVVPMEMEVVREVVEVILGEVAEIMRVIPVGAGEDLTMLAKTNRMNVVTIQGDMAKSL